MNAARPAQAGAPGTLAAFQDAFADALLADELDRTPRGQTPERAARAKPRADGATAAMDIAALVAQPGFAIYRNTVRKGCVDALQANYPAVARIVGDEWFRQAASLYVRANPPADPALVRFGEGFAGFLARFPPAAELPYLAAVALLDRLWTEAHVARDEPCLDAAALASLPPHDPTRLVLSPHAATRWAWFDTLPAFTLWRRNRAAGAFDDSAIAWVGEGALIVRPRDDVRSFPLAAAGCALLDACAAGHSVAASAGAVLAAHPMADFAALLARLVAAGALGRATASHTLPKEDE